MLSPHILPEPRGESATSVADSPQRLLRLAILGIIALFLSGLLLAFWLFPLGQDHRHQARLGACFYLFFANEPAVLVTGLLFLIGCYFWLYRQRSVTSARWPERSWRWVAGLAAAVFGLTALGTVMVYHRYPLAMDEYLVVWQSRAFQSGQVAVPLPVQLQPLTPALTPIFVAADRQRHTWTSGYLPVYAALHALATQLGIGLLLNPLLSALSVLLIAVVARQLWPDDRFAPLAAALLLAGSSQFLVTGMSFYSMPAHLCLNLFWLWLYLRAGRAEMLLLPWVGVAALGLHQPFMHALFAAPFLARLAFSRRWRVTVYTAAVYLFGCALWAHWWHVYRPDSDTVGGRVFGLPGLYIAISQWMGLIELLTWQNLAVGLLALPALVSIRRLPPAVRDLAWGLGLTFAFHFLLRFNQGHGWGYRYGHAVLGNFVLLAVAGGRMLGAKVGEGLAARLIIAATLFGLAVQLPLRCWQVERFVRPFAAANAFIRRLPEEVVVIDPTHVWYGEDLLRNDPLLAERPLVFDARKLSETDLAALRQRYSVRFLGTEELLDLGLCQRASP